MTIKLYLFACLLLILPSAAMAQEKTYAPFPSDFEKLDTPSKTMVLESIERNTDIYLHSPEYRKAIANFVAKSNPKNMNSCEKIEMDNTEGKNKISIDEPLLFARATDRHPMVGKWQHSARLIGCEKVFDFTIMVYGNKANSPNMVLKD